ncbi:type II toxin-antitoxin system HicA family toxin [Pseudomonas aeruginosa]|uniref:type II toxin-antitoxin system HicA family toxin n=1 Tax=Pseudomonas aeruginosa TaxID=287 RepID=UPI000F7E39E9|nr:type II toxin-antitoxin system HicA family toxin [Pseudomonas aeruginosa]RTB44082.1 type II toxin-antitoxin system HicA family toxin [Pseudomonas aeruginosa]
MSSARDLCRGHKQLLPLIEFALREGWEVTRTAGGHLRFVKPGLPPIITSSTPSDHRTEQNTKARMRRAQRSVGGSHG